MIKDIECPYCGHNFDDSDYYEYDQETTYELQCPECEKYMAASYTVSPHFTVEKAPCMNGEDHQWEKINGSPQAYFKYKRRCKWCDEEKCIDEEAERKELLEYFERMKSEK